MSEYPPSDYRRLTEAAAARYGVPADEILVGAGADEVLDIVAKAFLPAGGTAVIPTPSYAMYRVLTEQRRARVRPVPRLGPSAGYAIDLGLTRTIARGADLVWLCSPNNPTGLAEPDGAIAELLEGLARRRRAGRPRGAGRRPRRGLRRVRRLDPPAAPVRTTRAWSSSARMSKAYALAGLRVGFALAVRPTLAAMEPYRPPGLGLDRLGERRHGGPARPDDPAGRRRTRRDASAPGWRRASARPGWPAGPSVTNFLLVPFGSPERAGGGRRGHAPPRARAPHLPGRRTRSRITSGSRSARVDEDDRLIAAAAEIEAELGEAGR